MDNQTLKQALADYWFKVKWFFIFMWDGYSIKAYMDEIGGRDLDTNYCCNGRECECDGASIRQVYSPPRKAACAERYQKWRDAMTQPEYSREEVERLLALRNKATPGPWYIEPWEGDREQHLCYNIHDGKTGYGEDCIAQTDPDKDEENHNAMFIAASHDLANQLTAARDLLDAKDKEIERLREAAQYAMTALKDYAGMQEPPAPIRNAKRVSIVRELEQALRTDLSDLLYAGGNHADRS